jgi:hypothetical protein
MRVTLVRSREAIACHELEGRNASQQEGESPTTVACSQHHLQVVRADRRHSAVAHLGVSSWIPGSESVS